MVQVCVALFTLKSIGSCNELKANNKDSTEKVQKTIKVHT